MNALITTNTQTVTMSSLEMVDYINSTRKEGEAELLHKNFLAKVPQVLGKETSAKFLADLPDGAEKIIEQVLVTAKGLARLGHLLQALPAKGAAA